jgi:hypothetical protein
MPRKTPRAAGRPRFAPLCLALAAAPALCLACGPGRLPPPFEPVDIYPPAVLGSEPEGKAGLRVYFDEDVAVSGGGAIILDAAGAALPLAETLAAGRELVVAAEGELEPGADYRLECRVRDAWGNSASFVLPFTGLNERLPRLLLNEVRTDSSKPRCDMVELYALEPGSTAGMVLASGVVGDAEWVYRLPVFEAAAGEYIVIHLSRPEEGGWADETGPDLAVSAGTDAAASGRDLWYPGTAALAKGSGSLSLYGSPSGGIMDAFIYTDRTSESDGDYGGFGSEKMRRRAMAIESLGAWKAEGGMRPEACASSAGTTETRTLCRDSASSDGDGAADWHVAPTRGASFGAPNTDLRYDPASRKARKKPR